MTELFPRLVAFYLPQFHPIPENDRWWGEGFTDWVNVKKAKPLYPGHRQPRVPHSDLGYYDPREQAVLTQQAEIARAHGVHGFCFYHYWFNGKRLLETPVETFLRSREPDISFCLSWANEPWTRAWDGKERNVLMPQDYGSEADWEAHFNALLPAFRDRRAIRIDDKPVFLIYRLGSIPRAKDMFAMWRRLAMDAGLPGLHIVSMLTGYTSPADYRGVDIDATCEFHPTYAWRPRPLDVLGPGIGIGLPARLLRRYSRGWTSPRVFVDYDALWRRILSSRRVFPRQYRGAFISWDNSPRKGSNAFFVRNASPARYRYWLTRQLERVRDDAQGGQLIFLNAWNEWAEGAYLEPDEYHGYQYLEATRDALYSALGDGNASDLGGRLVGPV